MPVKGETMKPGDVQLTVGVECPSCGGDGCGWEMGKSEPERTKAKSCDYCSGNGTVSHRIPTVPNLAEIARYLSAHPETVTDLHYCIAEARDANPQDRRSQDAIKSSFQFIKAMRGESGE